MVYVVNDSKAVEAAEPRLTCVAIRVDDTYQHFTGYLRQENLMFPHEARRREACLAPNARLV